ncbi:hypothetical protein HG535_0C05270 [Zygotorulaspora mrakii]|uniref:Methionine--tRNA ligase, mitochondrial n=1 Tax=Zygotorulaspora mrakii TaxID=42260 RepID=A0A7H9B0X8_ZYGMR|nr:uncharacterized protein HG535_0C05270 [Zygotorulaspora mrakii]QLG72173.1 hypothetical protein HG535_0C05270 [Zygotorulaspora mrakii]
MTRRLLNCRLYSHAFHVTTPIFYPNAKPHLGHLYSSLLCDVFHRWQLFKGNGSLFTTGTDEHGLKIQLASMNMHYANPKEFVDELYKDFVRLDENANIKYTRFIRTTDPDHVINVKKLWNLCLKNGYIYKGQHSGWYSISDETFYPESRVIPDPKDSRKYINTESNNDVVYHSETNYFFKLSAFKDRLVSHISNNPSFISPEVKRQQILKELTGEGALQDLSVSRPSCRLKWGIDVPQDPSQKIYVWFDALCNYISSIGGIDAISRNNLVPTNAICHNMEGNPYQNSKLHPQLWWKNTTHLIGKDIIKFHTIYWPSFLMAASLPLPKRIVVHSHWLCDGFKMSKSLGNVVDPIEMIEYYGEDPLRWFLLENSQLEEDGDFQESKLFKVKEMMAMKWGNLINRCCGNKFNLQRAVSTFSNGETQESVQNVFESESMIKKKIEQIFLNLSELSLLLDHCINSFQLRAALRTVWSLIDEANTLIQLSEPWSRNSKEQDAIIYTCMETSRIISILCQPIIPKLSCELLDRIDVSAAKRTLKYAEAHTDNSYGSNANSKGRGAPIKRINKRAH